MPTCTWLEFIAAPRRCALALALLLAQACLPAPAAAAKAPAAAASSASGATNACAAGAKAPAKPLEVKLLDGEAVTFRAAGTEASVVLPLTLGEGVDATRLVARRQQVRRDALADEALASHFEVAPALLVKGAGGSGPLPALMVSVKRVEALLPARYTLAVALLHDCGWPIAPLSIKLDRPAATLLPPGKVTLDLFLPIGMGLTRATAAPHTLWLQPADGLELSALRGAELHEEGFRGANGVAGGGTLGPVKAASAAAGRPLALSFEPAGFDVGVAQGKAQLRSPDLKAPLAIEFEVRARLLRGWIVAVVLAGIAFAWWLRVTLQSRIERERLRIDGLTVLEELQRRTRDIADAAFQSTTRSALEALRDALLRGGDADIVARRDAAKAVVDKADTTLKAALARAQQELAALRELPAGRGVLPPALQAAIDALGAPCDAAAARLNVQDAGAALRELATARQAFEAALDREWPGAEHALAQHDRALGRLAGLLDPQQATSRKLDEEARFADQDYTALAAELALPDLADPVALRAAMGRWRQLGRRRPQALRDWAAWLREDRARLDALAVRRMAGRSDLATQRQALHDAVQALAEALESASTRADPFGAVVDLEPRSAAAFDAARTLIGAVAQSHAALGDEARAAMDAALDAGQVFAALLALPVPAAATTMSAQDAERGAPKAAAAPSLPALAQRETQAASDRFSAAPVIDTAALEAMRARSARELARAQGLQTAIVAAVTVAVAYAFFEERFIGTPTELLGLFFWGFTADLSVDGLFKMAGGLSAKAKS